MWRESVVLPNRVLGNPHFMLAMSRQFLNPQNSICIIGGYNWHYSSGANNNVYRRCLNFCNQMLQIMEGYENFGSLFIFIGKGTLVDWSDRGPRYCFLSVFHILFFFLSEFVLYDVLVPPLTTDLDNLKHWIITVLRYVSWHNDPLYPRSLCLQPGR